MAIKKLFLIGSIILAAISILPGRANLANAAENNTCQEILTRAMQTLDSTCNGVGRNKACYGNNLVKAEPNGSASLKFDTTGDVASIRDIRTISTSPLNTDQGTWGLSLLKLQANLPDSLPGQNVTFVVFGDTSIENTSGDMKAFYFSSGLGTPSCKEAPRDAIVVKSPHHAEVTFNANGVQITIASTIVMRAQRGQDMSVTLVEGHARVTAAGVSQVLQPGQSVTVPLGGDNGMTASGAPSTPTAAEEDTNLTPVLDTATQVEDPVTDDTEANVTIIGCVTAVHGNFITINDIDINIGSDQTLKALRQSSPDDLMDQCFTIQGQWKTNNGKGNEFVLVKAQGNGKKGDNANNAGGNGKGKGNNGDMGNAGGNGGDMGNAGGNGGGKNK